MSELPYDERIAQGEQYLAARLNWPAIYQGDTTPEIRRDRIRAGIKERNLADVRIGKSGETIALFFKRLYGEPL